jgi:hypothetical protein
MSAIKITKDNEYKTIKNTLHPAINILGILPKKGNTVNNTSGSRVIYEAMKLSNCKPIRNVLKNK